MAARKVDRWLHTDRVGSQVRLGCRWGRRCPGRPFSCHSCLLPLSFRAFSAVVQKRYLSAPAERTKCHLLLADFFRGTWSWGMKKPVELPSSSKPVSFDRKVKLRSLEKGAKEFSVLWGLHSGKGRHCKEGRVGGSGSPAWPLLPIGQRGSPSNPGYPSASVVLRYACEPEEAKRVAVPFAACRANRGAATRCIG